MKVTNTGGRDITIVLDDHTYEIVWSGRVRHQHAEQAISCSMMGGIVNL